jgi:hypothetical protein
MALALRPVHDLSFFLSTAYMQACQMRNVLVCIVVTVHSQDTKEGALQTIQCEWPMLQDECNACNASQAVELLLQNTRFPHGDTALKP